MSEIIERMGREMHDQIIRQEGITKVKTVVTDMLGNELVIDTTKVSQSALIEGAGDAQPLE